MKRILLVGALLADIVIASAQMATTMHNSSNMHSKTAIRVADLMQPIRSNVSADYAGATIKKAYIIKKNGDISYEVLIKNNKTKWELFYDKDGRFIEKSEMKNPFDIITEDGNVYDPYLYSNGLY